MAVDGSQSTGVSAEVKATTGTQNGVANERRKNNVHSSGGDEQANGSADAPQRPDRGQKRDSEGNGNQTYVGSAIDTLLPVVPPPQA